MIAWALAVALLSAAAQQSTGTLIPGRDSSSPGGSSGSINHPLDSALKLQASEMALSNARQMAKCVWSHAPRLSAGVLASQDKRNLDIALNQLMPDMEFCLAIQSFDYSKLGMSVGAIHGLIAEARFKREGWPNLAPVEYASVTSGSDWITEDPGQKVVLRTADCLAARQPDKVIAVLRAPVSSAEENIAFANLAPSISGCLERGVSLTAKRSGLRLALATAVDRRVRQPQKPEEKRN